VDADFFDELEELPLGAQAASPADTTSTLATAVVRV